MWCTNDRATGSVTKKATRSWVAFLFVFILAADPGIEPGFPDSESGVLPLDESATANSYQC